MLRPLAADDAAALAAAGASLGKLYTVIPRGVDGARAYIERALTERDAGQRVPFAIVWQGALVGSTSYLDVQRWRWPAGSAWQRSDRPDAVEIGATWLATAAQRTRCNTEAKYLLLSHAFDVWDVHRASFRTDERNEPSRRAIERLGAALEGIRRADMPGADGTVRSSACYSILRAEWPAIRARLAAGLAR